MIIWLQLQLVLAARLVSKEMFAGNEKALSVFLQRYTEGAILIANVGTVKVESQ
jgi:hypothetical protein